MADKRITELTELLSPSGDDLFPIVDISDVQTKKITFTNILSGALDQLGAHGEMYENNPTGSSILISTPGNARPWISAGANVVTDNITFAKDPVGGDKLIVNDVAAAGDYRLTATYALIGGSNNVTLLGNIYKNDSALVNAYWERKFSSSTDLGSIAIASAYTTMVKDDYISVKFDADATTTMQVRFCSVTIERL